MLGLALLLFISRYVLMVDMAMSITDFDLRTSYSRNGAVI